MTIITMIAGMILAVATRVCLAGVAACASSPGTPGWRNVADLYFNVEMHTLADDKRAYKTLLTFISTLK